MKLTGNTVLITGGGSGIGLETAKLFAANGNRVIITGRDSTKLEKAASLIPGIAAIPCDVTDETQVAGLVARIKKEFGGLNILINNAGMAQLHRLSNETASYSIAQKEITTNYLAVVNLTAQVLPLLKAQEQAAIINVSSILGLAPVASLPTYSASKAALHAYTQVLRLSLADTAVQVFEIMPSLVDTDFAKDIPSDEKLTAKEVAIALINGLETDTHQVHVGQTVGFYRNFFSQSTNALQALNAGR